MKFESAREYLNQFISFERTLNVEYKEGNFNLARLRRFLKHIAPEAFAKSKKYILVAGSKGKGSVASILSYYIAKSGYKVGTFLSPHVFDIRERIAVNGVLISKSEFADLVEVLKSFEATESGLTFFELLLCLAVKHFSNLKVDYVILESGLGGRFDATSIFKPVLNVFTFFEREHEDFFGKGIESVVKEELTICSDFDRCVFSPQQKKVRDLITQISGRSFDFSKVKDWEFGFFNDLSNYSAAKRALLRIFGRCDEALLKKSVEEARALGRFQILRSLNDTEMVAVLDMAHTKFSARSLCSDLIKKFGDKKMIYLIALLADKDYKAILRELLKVCRIGDEVVFTTAPNPRALAPSILSDYFQKSGSTPCKVIASHQDATNYCMTKIKKSRLLVVTGSATLLGTALKALKLKGFK